MGNEAMKTDWKVTKDDGAPPARRWRLQYRPAGYAWETMGAYPTRKAALTVGFLMRERGENISWHGGPIRIGIALVDSCGVLD